MYNMKIKLFVLSVVILAFVEFSLGAPPQKGTTISPKYPEGKSPDLCKEAEEGLPEKNRTTAKFRIEEKTGKCHVVNGIGPCGSNMIFAEKEGSNTFGICDCDRKKSERYLIFHAEKNQCYFIFEQAYCKDNEWLTLNKKNEPTCETNPCTKEAKENPESVFVYLKDDEDESKCRELETQAEYCLPGQILLFKSGYVLPQCDRGSDPHAAMPEVEDKVVCHLGEKRSQNNMCYKDSNFPD